MQLEQLRTDMYVDIKYTYLLMVAAKKAISFRPARLLNYYEHAWNALCVAALFCGSPGRPSLG